MNPHQTARTALAVGAMLVFCCAQASACVLCDLTDHDLHPLPEASQVSAGVGLYSYDAPAPRGGRTTTAVPVFNSLPGAHAKLFLDFDGVDFGAVSWSGKTPGLRPAYDIDGDAGSFGREELSRIEQIWSRVAEAYSMFNINVTTQDPGNHNRRESAHLVISGDNSWYGGGGGVAYVGGFTSSGTSKVRRTGWVFPGNLRSGDAKVVADAAIHEAGHLFGLNHQSTFSSSGTRTDEYDNNSDSDTRAPNLGVAYNSRRGLWSIGANSNNANSQIDELSVIGNAFTNQFGFAPDEPGQDARSAPLVTLSETPLRGVIDESNDVDFYKFELQHRSEVSLLMDVAEYGPNLDARLSLYDATLALLHDDDPTLSTSRASLTATYNGVLEAGAYYLRVGSHGGYTYSNGPRNRFLQDAGQYFLSGAVLSLAPEPAAALLALAALCGHTGLRPRRRG